jgi:hypothetical protein
MLALLGILIQAALLSATLASGALPPAAETPTVVRQRAPMQPLAQRGALGEPHPQRRAPRSRRRAQDPLLDELASELEDDGFASGAAVAEGKEEAAGGDDGPVQLGAAPARSAVLDESAADADEIAWFLTREPAELKLYSLIYDHRQTLALPWTQIATQLCDSQEMADEAPWWCDSSAGVAGVGTHVCRTLFRTRYGGDKMARSATRGNDAWLAIDQYGVRKVHMRKNRGGQVRIGIFDSGIGRALDTAEVRRAQYAFNVTKISTTWHPHTNRSLKTCHDFTLKDSGCKGAARCSCADTLGHGNLAAGVITGESDMCPGLAPDAELHMFKVFDKVQATSSGWLIDALNYAIFLELDILVLPYGGFPNFRERPVMDKINEALSEGIVVISACGNEGPIYGSHLSPSDHAGVLSVGAIERWKNKQKVPLGGVKSPGTVMDVSGRGFTNWESPSGRAGRYKPELVAHGFDVWGPSMVWTNDAVDVCKRHWGTSVAATLVGGAVALMIGALTAAERALLVNPASIKQALVATAQRLPPMQFINPLAMGLMEPIENTALEQGAGLLRVDAAIHAMRTMGPHVSTYPAELNLTDCPYMWPYCEQPMYAGAMPILLNVTLVNSMGVTGKVHRPCEWVPDGGATVPLRVECIYPDLDDDMWPWVGWIGLSLTVSDNASTFTGTVSGTVKILVSSPPGKGVYISFAHSSRPAPPPPHPPLTRASTPPGLIRAASFTRITGELKRRSSIASVRLTQHIVPTPPREKRVLWDQFHNMGFPPVLKEHGGFPPRDSLEVFGDNLDWNGDHLFSNHRGVYAHLRKAGYFIEVLDLAFTCFDAERYAVLMIVDAEDEFHPEEIAKLESDVRTKKLSVVAFADWFNTNFYIPKRVAFQDPRSKRMMSPVTGGANTPAYNDLLQGFNITLSQRVYRGAVALPDCAETWCNWGFKSGSSVHFGPKGSRTFLVPEIEDSVAKAKGTSFYRPPIAAQVPILGALQVDGDSAGRIVVHGDSNCIDEAHLASCSIMSDEGCVDDGCWGLLTRLVDYAASGVLDAVLDASMDTHPAVERFPWNERRPVRDARTVAVHADHSRVCHGQIACSVAEERSAKHIARAKQTPKGCDKSAQKKLAAKYRAEARCCIDWSPVCKIGKGDVEMCAATARGK